MVRKRLVTVLTFNNGVLFRTRNFVPDYRYTLKFVDTWSVDEIVLLDITRPQEGNRENFYNVVQLFAQNCFVPLTVGGSINTIDDIKQLLQLGADKVSINSKLLEEPEFISQAAKTFGSQCVVVSIDAGREEGGDGYLVYSKFGKVPTGKTPDAWAAFAESLGAGEVLVQSIDRDGTLEGYDNKLNRLVSNAVEIPVLVCSGAGSWQHFVDGFQEGGASAVCTTNIYHFTESSIKSAKKFLVKAGIEVRV